ncbi:hypothetical protein PQ459_16235 [Chryseobacterium sp. KACC 21268]|nr:hypothetical protein PQ459_16235 [Chryseobacterium sp. KACC 21268]
MRKLIMICMMMAVPVLANAQTKEETISWLKEKLKTCLVEQNSNTRLVSIDECQFTIQYDQLYNDNTKDTDEVSFPFDGVTIKDGQLIYELDVIKRFRLGKANSKVYYKTSSVLLRLCETDIYARMQKAMQHLSTFCPKQKETF